MKYVNTTKASLDVVGKGNVAASAEVALTKAEAEHSVNAAKIKLGFLKLVAKGKSTVPTSSTQKADGG